MRLGVTAHAPAPVTASECGFIITGCLTLNQNIRRCDFLSKAPAGSAVLLHACAHNPTGEGRRQRLPSFAAMQYCRVFVAHPVLKLQCKLVC